MGSRVSDETGINQKRPSVYHRHIKRVTNTREGAGKESEAQNN